MKHLTEAEFGKIAVWLMDVTTEPPEQELLVRFFCDAKKVRRWDKRGRAAVEVVVGALLEMREMVVKVSTRHEEAVQKNKKLIRVAIDAETTSVVLKHRLAVTEEVAAAFAAGGGARLDKAIAHYKALLATTS